MNDPSWITKALHDAGASAFDSTPHVDVTDRVLRTLANAEPPTSNRPLLVTAIACCLIAGSTVAYAAQVWSAASDPVGAAFSPVRLALTDG